MFFSDIQCDETSTRLSYWHRAVAAPNRCARFRRSSKESGHKIGCIRFVQGVAAAWATRIIKIDRIRFALEEAPSEWQPKIWIARLVRRRSEVGESVRAW